MYSNKSNGTASLPRDSRPEHPLWFITLPADFWHAFTSTEPRRLPAWREEPWVERIRHRVHLFDPLIAVCEGSGELANVGYFFTRGYRVRDGYTAEVYRLAPLDGTVALPALVADGRVPSAWTAEVSQSGSVTSLGLKEAFTLVEGTHLWGPLAHMLGEIDRIGQREIAREALYGVLAEQGCSDDEAHEVLHRLSQLAVLATKRPKPAHEIHDMMGTLIHLLHAGDQPTPQWSHLWDRLISVWRTYHTVEQSADGNSPRARAIAAAQRSTARTIPSTPAIEPLEESREDLVIHKVG